VKEARARGDAALDPEQLEKLRQRYDEAAAFGIDAIRAALKGNPGYRHSPHWPDVRLRATRKWRLWEPARSDTGVRAAIRASFHNANFCMKHIVSHTQFSDTH
jgi:hypothetical protein